MTGRSRHDELRARAKSLRLAATYGTVDAFGRMVEAADTIDALLDEVAAAEARAGERMQTSDYGAMIVAQKQAAAERARADRLTQALTHAEARLAQHVDVGDPLSLVAEVIDILSEALAALPDGTLNETGGKS